MAIGDMFTLTVATDDSKRLTYVAAATEIIVRGRSAELGIEPYELVTNFLYGLEKYLEKNPGEYAARDVIDIMKGYIDRIEKQADAIEKARQPRPGALPASGPKRKKDESA